MQHSVAHPTPIAPVFLRAAQAARFIGVSIATFNRMRRKDPSLPPPRLVRPGVQAWLAAELAAWAHARPVADGSAPPKDQERRPVLRGIRKEDVQRMSAPQTSGLPEEEEEDAR